MANRKSTAKVKTSSIQNSSRARGEQLTTKELLTYLATPLYLPPFDASRSSYKHFIIRTIRDLLIDAIRNILPSKVVGVQFIFARRPKHATAKGHSQVQADFSFPFLLCCSSEKEAINISDGLSYVTKFLMNRTSSFHQRVRRFELTSSPAVCIFSASDDDNSFAIDSTNVLWIKLPISNANSDQITFPFADYLEDLGEPKFDDRSFFEANLAAAVDAGYFDKEKATSVVIKPALANIKVIRQSHPTSDWMKRKALDEMRGEFSADVNYLKRVSYLLKFGDVILCTPHAYNDVGSKYSHHPINSHEMITDAGLTVIIDPNKGIIEDDWLRVQVVAQKLAIFAGAAISTASEARGSILRTLNDGFEHEFRNARGSIQGRLERLLSEGKPLSVADVSDIDGRLKFTQRYIDSAVNTYKSDETDEVTIQVLIDRLVSPLQQFINVEITLESELAEEYTVMTLWSAVVIEVLRNAYKYCPVSSSTFKKGIEVSARLVENNIVLLVTNELAARYESTYQFNNRPKGWELIEEISTLLKGHVAASVNGRRVSVTIQMPILNLIGRRYV